MFIGFKLKWMDCITSSRLLVCWNREILFPFPIPLSLSLSVLCMEVLSEGRIIGRGRMCFELVQK